MLKFPIAHTNDWLHTCDPLYYKSRHIWNLGSNLNWNDMISPSFIGHATSLNDRRELMKSHGISSVKNKEWRTVISWWKTFQLLPLLLNDRYCVQKSRGHHSVLLQWRHNEHDSVSNHQPHIVYSTVYSGADQRKYQTSASLTFVRGIHRWPVNSPHKGP